MKDGVAAPRPSLLFASVREVQRRMLHLHDANNFDFSSGGGIVGSPGVHVSRRKGPRIIAQLPWGKAMYPKTLIR